MADTTLGLDLGPNSIGWALLDESANKIIAMGVRIFPEGVDRDTSGAEKSKTAERRTKRGMRRQIARRSRRKRDLRQLLRESQLWPNDTAIEQTLLLSDPYELRRRALSEKLEPFEIGRVLLHLNQRRGFLSNRKTDRAKKKENSDMLKAISALQEEIETSGHQTLGEHLATIRHVNPLTRVRGRHTRRDMLRREFDLIWQTQSRFHPLLLTGELKLKLDNPARDNDWMHHGIIFGQRNMYWPKSVVGACELEPKKKRCPRADRVAQRCRLLQEVNNLRLLDSSTTEERKLTDEERAKLITYLETKEKAEFDAIRKHLGLYEHVRFNLERGDRKKLDGMPTDYRLANKGPFGKKEWFKLSEEKRNAIVRSLIDDDEETIRRRAVEEWGLSADSAEVLVDLDLGEGYSSFSREALEKLLPHLERGLLMMSNDKTPCALSEAGYLRPDQRTVNQKPLLPAPPDITNPIVRQALHEVRKVVNAIIREYGMPARIHIEMAREVKGTAEDRAKASKAMRDRGAERDHAAEEIRKLGLNVSRDAIDKFLLWIEQNKTCVYSGSPISQAQLFGGEADVDHILPRHRSLDNSFNNRILCFRSENAAKGDRTPYEWLAETQPKKYEELLQRIRHLPYGKQSKFRQKELILDDFVNRQLTDTAYITRKVREYVECLGTDVVCTKGALTADLRWLWGLNEVLRHDDLDIKNRDDHRHHAVDALVIALTNRSRLHRLSRLYRPAGLDPDTLPLPWDNFRNDVETMVNTINVSHRPRRKVAGALHEETIYGPTQKPHRRASANDDRPWAKNWIEKDGHFVYRKPVEALTLAMIDDIRDETIRNIIITRLAQFGLSPGQKGNIPKEAWKEPLTMPSGVPIKKVRLVKKEGTIQPIRGGTAYVKPGNTHHIALFESTDQKGKTRCEGIWVTMIEAAERTKLKKPILRRDHDSHPGAIFKFSICKGDSLLAEFSGQERLVIFLTSASTQGQLYFKEHTDARPDKAVKKYVATANSLRGCKVAVDVLGRIRDAND